MDCCYEFLNCTMFYGLIVGLMIKRIFVYLVMVLVVTVVRGMFVL